MARVFRYVRPVDAVLTSVDLGNKTYPSEDGVKIKEEPPDFDDPNILLTDVDNTVAQNVSTKPVRRRSNTVNTKNNECNLIREPVGSGRNDSSTSRKKRKRNLNDDLDLQCVERKRRRNTSSREIKDVPSKNGTHEGRQEMLCDVCFVPFFSKKKLFHHTLRYRSLMLCEYCSAPFNLRATLCRHKLIHFRKYGPAPRAKLECYFCERRFDSKARVQMHLFHCHANVMQTYMCDNNKSKTNTAMHRTSDADKNREHTRTKILATRVINRVEENTCRNDATTHAITNVEEGIRRKDTTMHVTDRAEEDTRRKDTTMRVINNAEKSTSGKDTTMRAINNADKNTCWKDTTMHITNSAEEDTRRKDTTMHVTNSAEEDKRRKDATVRAINDVDKNTCRKDHTVRVSNSTEENTCGKETTERVFNNVEDDTRSKNVTMCVSNHVEETSTSTCAKDATMRTIDNVEEPVEDIYMNDTTLILDHVDKMNNQNTLMKDTKMPVIDDTEHDICIEETIIIINSDNEVERDISMDDTIIFADSDMNKLGEHTPIEEIMDIIGVSKEVKQYIPTDNSRNCPPNNADKIEENISTGDNTSRAIDDVDRVKAVDTIKQDLPIKRRGRPAKKAINKIRQSTHTADSTNLVPENDGKMKENMQAKGTVVSETNNVGTEKPPIKRKKRKNKNVNGIEENLSKRHCTKVDTEIKGVQNAQNSSINIGTDFLHHNIKIEPVEEDSADCIIIDVENINEITSTKNNVTHSTENVDKTQGNISHIRNTAEKIQRSVPTEDTETLVTSTVPTVPIAFSPAPSSTLSSSTLITSTTPTITTPQRSKTCSPTKKRMRQTTLMEFLSISGNETKHNAIKTENVDDTEASSNVSDQNAKEIVRDTVGKIPTNNTPLLRMHMDPDSIIDLLNNHIKSEPLDTYDSNVSQNSPYNLRKTKPDSCRSSPHLHGTISPNVMSAKRKSRSSASKRTSKPNMLLLEKLKAKYKCKDCVVRLERCDYTSKRVVFKTDMSKSTIPLQLTIGGKTVKDSLSGKNTNSSSPTIRIVKLENCIVVEVMESR